MRAGQAPAEPQNQGVAVNGSIKAWLLTDRTCQSALALGPKAVEGGEGPKPRPARLDFQALQKIIIGCQIRRYPRSVHTSPESQEWMTLGTSTHLDPTRRT